MNWVLKAGMIFLGWEKKGMHSRLMINLCGSIDAWLLVIYLFIYKYNFILIVFKFL